MEYRRPQTYEERFLSLSTKMEKSLFRLALIGFTGIIISQIILSVPELRSVLSVTDRMEGENIAQTKAVKDSAHTATKELVIRPLQEQASSAKVWVKINGTPVAQITSAGVILKVRERDVLEIDSSAQEGIFQFEIDHNDPTISSPLPGTFVETSQSHSAVIEPILFQN